MFKHKVQQENHEKKIILVTQQVSEAQWSYKHVILWFCHIS